MRYSTIFVLFGKGIKFCYYAGFRLVVDRKNRLFVIKTEREMAVEITFCYGDRPDNKAPLIKKYKVGKGVSQGVWTM